MERVTFLETGTRVRELDVFEDQRLEMRLLQKGELVRVKGEGGHGLDLPSEQNDITKTKS